MKIAQYIATSLLLLGATSVHGGTVSFDPGFVEVDPGTGVTSVLIDVSVAPDSLDAFNYVSLQFQSELTLLAFNYSDNWLDAQVFPIPIICPIIGPCFTPIGGVLSVPSSVSLLVGRIEVYVGGVAPGDYTILVDSEIGLYTESEPLVGSVTIHVIPEPVTLVLLLVGLSLKFRHPKVA